MKSKRKITSLTIAAAILLTGCGNTENTDNSDEEQDSSYSSSAVSSDSEQNSDSSEPAEEILLTIEGGVLKNVPSDLTEVTIPDVVTEIGNAFSECENLTSVILPDTVEKIEKNAFRSCKDVVVTYKGKSYSYKQLEDLYDMINLGEVQPKTQLTEEELRSLFLQPSMFSLCNECVKSSSPFDITISINNLQEFNYAIAYLTNQISNDEADLVEYDPNMALFETYYYYFSPETTEKLFQKYYCSSFELNSINYTESPYWDTDKNQFVVETVFDCWQVPVYDGNYYVYENAFKKGDYYYVDAAYINEYKGLSDKLEKNAYINNIFGDTDYNVLNLSDITSDYFDIPRCRLKFKQYKNKEYNNNEYFLVGCEPLEERPEWLDTAEKLFPSASELFSDENILIDGFNSKVSAGVISTPYGKRIYGFMYGNIIPNGERNFIKTIGLRGENDEIDYQMSYAGTASGGPQNSTSHWIECNDIYSNNEYYYDITELREDIFDENGVFLYEDKTITETWKLNGKEITSEEFNSADVISYCFETFGYENFSRPFEFESDYSYEMDYYTRQLFPLGEYLNMCRVIAG